MKKIKRVKRRAFTEKQLDMLEQYLTYTRNYGVLVYQRMSQTIMIPLH